MNENWKDDVLNCVTGISKAEPNSLLYHTIREKIIYNARMKPSVVKKPYLALAAACLALVLTANIWIFNQSHVTSSLPTDYPIDLANFNLY